MEENLVINKLKRIPNLQRNDVIKQFIVKRYSANSNNLV